MRKNEWISIVAIMFFISVVSAFTTLFISNKYFITKIKTVSMVEVLKDTNDDSYQKFLDGTISQDEYSELKIDESLDIELINSKSRIGKKKAWKIKNFYGAKLDPFAVILDGEKPIKAFYTEAEDVIDSLIKYLNNNGK